MPSALSTVLATFLGPQGSAWNAYASVTGVIWLDAAPIEYAAGRYARTGRILLEGFGAASLPDGGVGANAGSVTGNEGESGLTLDGDKDSVRVLSVRKFYAESDYSSLLERQFGAGSSIDVLASNCLSDNAGERTAFYELTVPDGKTAYVEAVIEEASKSGPGYTVLDFTRDKPEVRVRALQCERR